MARRWRRLRTSIADLDKSLERVDDQLAGDVSRVCRLSEAPSRSPAADIQALLNADEALVLFLDIQATRPAAGGNSCLGHHQEDRDMAQHSLGHARSG